jgi:hypothetical protein
LCWCPITQTTRRLRRFCVLEETYIGDTDFKGLKEEIFSKPKGEVVVPLVEGDIVNMELDGDEEEADNEEEKKWMMMEVRVIVVVLVIWTVCCYCYY